MSIKESGSLNNLNYPHQFDYLFYPSEKAYHKALKRERKKKEHEERRLNERIHYENLPSLIYDYQLPFYANYVEAYSLFYFMITGDEIQNHYLNPRHKWLHLAIEGMYKSGWADNMGTNQLIQYLHEQDWIKRVGGEYYVRKLFGDLDVYNVTYRRGAIC